MRHRELLRDLARLAYETIKELMIEAVPNQNPSAYEIRDLRAVPRLEFTEE
jgi:hypothetical protein